MSNEYQIGQDMATLRGKVATLRRRVKETEQMLDDMSDDITMLNAVRNALIVAGLIRFDADKESYVAATAAEFARE